MAQPFIKIDEQSWYCHFKTEAPHAALSKLYWGFGCQLLRLLQRSKSIEIVNAFHPDGVDKVIELNQLRKQR
ncbi:MULTISPECIES: hypothetical protein [unclassified Vibrio]|uniref:hypothetical protein n=1 Tax=unclassified Vibrio TaxID=2614977 RepID=UPI00354DB4B0